MTRVLVLGGGGRVGRLLRQAWFQDHDKNPNVCFTFQTRYVQESLPNDLLWDILQGPPPMRAHAAGFDCMIVLSGVVPKPGADFTLNTKIGTASVVAAERLGIPHVLLASTSAVYGTYSNEPFSEHSALHPTNEYGKSKRDMEQAAHRLAHSSGVALCCLRIGNVAGADALLRNAKALAPGENLRLDTFENGGTPLRSYIGPHSLARTLVSLIYNRAKLPAAVNIATPLPVSMGALAEAAHIPLDLHRVSESAHQYVTLDCSVLDALHDFDPCEFQPLEMIRQWRRLDASPFLQSGRSST